MTKVPDQAESIKEKIGKDTFVDLFVKEGSALLEETNRPNVITVEQFMPYIELFNIDKERYGPSKDDRYTKYIHQLNSDFTHVLGINLYEVTYIIASKEDQTVVGFLNRRFTRINSDHTLGNSARDHVPIVVSKTSGTTRENMLMEASVKDLIAANSTPEQMAFFARIKMESSVIEREFTQRNLTPSKRPENAIPSPTTVDDESDDSFGVMLSDDE